LHAAQPPALGPEEEALVEQLLAQGKGELGGNPYALPGLEAELLVLEHGPDGEHGPHGSDAQAGGGAKPRGHGGLIGFGDGASSALRAAPSSTAASSRGRGSFMDLTNVQKSACFTKKQIANSLLSVKQIIVIYQP
jgi:hypothetical protein